MSEEKIKVAFIDVDRTIFSTNSGNILVWKAYTSGLMGFSQLLKAAWYALLYRTRIGNPSEIIDKMALWTNGVKQDDLEILCKQIFNTYLRQKIRPEMIQEVMRLKNDRVRIVILSAALSAICKPTAEVLGIDEIICSDLEVVDGKFTGKPKGKLCYGVEKLNRVVEYCQVNKIDLKNTSCYTDSVSDISVLEVVAYPFCISPDSRLRKEAITRGWKVIDW